MRPVKVEILGNEYLLRSKAGEGHVRRVAAHLNARINEILQDSKATSNLAATVLAALNITNDLLLIKDQQEEMLQEIEAKSKRMLDKLEHGEP